MMMRIFALEFLCLALIASTGCGTAPEQVLTPEEAKAIAKEAYLYGFPMVMNYKTMYNYVIDTENPEYKGPFNQVACEARLFTPEDRAIVPPNSDTPYCMFWMDLRAEPLVLTVPGMDPERFYHFQFIDLYTHNFAYVGTLTSGNGAGKFLITGPDWQGEKPEGINGVIRSETEFIFNITRRQLFDPDDLDRVKEIQASYDLEPLSAFLGGEALGATPLPDFPKWVEGAQFDESFFNYFDFMLSLLEKPGPGEEELWAKLSRLGIGPDNSFDHAALAPEMQDALKAAVGEAFSEIEHFIATYSADPLLSGKIFGTRRFLVESATTNFQLEKPHVLVAAAAHAGLYGNSGAEAVYPAYFVDAERQPLNAAENSYTFTFAARQLPRRSRPSGH